MISCFFGNHSTLADCIITSVVPNALIRTHFPEEGVITAQTWLASPRSPRPAAGKPLAAALLGHRASQGRGPQRFLPSALSVAPSGRAPPRLSPTPHHPTPRIWSIPLHLVLVHWNRCLLLLATMLSILFCFSVLFLPSSLLLAKDDITEMRRRESLLRMLTECRPPVSLSVTRASE